jgi:hypothetical protein
MDDRSCNDATSCCGTGTYWKAKEEKVESAEEKARKVEAEKLETAEEKAEREKNEEDYKTHEGVCGDGKI